MTRASLSRLHVASLDCWWRGRPPDTVCTCDYIE